MVLYYIIFFFYRFALDENQKRKFEIIAKYCNDYSDLIPLSFVLGFYVNLVMQRWWNMYCSIPSTDTLSIFVSNSIHGQDERCRLMRRTIMRYVNLSYVLILAMISTRVKKRFPTLDHIVDAGVMLPNEKKIFDNLNSRSCHHKYWMPLVWAGSIIARARKEGRIRDDFAVKTLLDEICNFRAKCGALNGYDWVNIPLVYTQVVTLAVYSFFVATLMGRQLVGEQTELYFPVFAFLQFFFYMGWLKVAESMVNPFGEDDDDFETNWLIDRNLQVSYLIVDEMHAEHPDLIRDQYWDDVLPDELPHTVASQALGNNSPYMGSTAHIAIPAQQTEIFGSVTPQLHKLDEVSEASTILDDDIPSDGGESGITIKEQKPKRRLKRQTSVQSEATNSFRVSRKPSIISVFQRVFNNKEGPAGMGSSVSIASSRRPNFKRSSSRYSRPQSPVSTYNPDEIFKMSDISLNVSASNLQATRSIDHADETRRPPRGPPSLFKKMEKIGRYGKTLGVEGQVHPASTSINNTEEQEPLILTTSAMDSYNNSPLLVLKKYPSQRSISPSAFSFSTAIESSQTDQCATDKVSEVDESRTTSSKEEESTLAGSAPPGLPPRIQLDSLKGEEGLEVIAEQAECANSPVAKLLE